MIADRSLFTEVNGKLVAEASDLVMQTLTAVLGPDAAEPLFVVMSPGRTCRFVCTKVNRDVEGDITHWDFVGTDGTRLTVFND